MLSQTKGDQNAEGEPTIDAVLLSPSPHVFSDQAFVEVLGPHLARLARLARLLCANAATADELLAEAISRSLVPWRRGGVTDPVAYMRRVMINLLARRARRLALSRRRDHRGARLAAHPHRPYR